MGTLHSTGLLGSGLLSTDTLDGSILTYLLTGDHAMPFVDFTAINDYLSFLVLTTDAGGIAADADAVPGYTILDPKTGTVLVTGGTTTKISSTTGVYAVNEQITTAKGFAAGYTYSLLATWTVSGSAYQQQYTFKVD